MNTHLNIFKFYAKEDRSYQLENDLTRALAICLREEPLLMHELMRTILTEKTYKSLFSTYSEASEHEINIQQNVDDIDGVNKVFCVSLSAKELNTKTFFEKKPKSDESSPITDLFIKFDDVAIIFEVKPSNIDCAAQLYRQALKIQKNNQPESKQEAFIQPVDLNWKKLMQIVANTSKFKAAINRKNEILEDFIEIIKQHNHRWLPVNAFNFLKEHDITLMRERLKLALINSENEILENRLGFKVHYKWANELLFNFKKENNKTYLEVSVCPGNTKGQGWHLFKGQKKPEIKAQLNSNAFDYELHKQIHLKFSHFNSYFSSIDAKESDCQKEIMTFENFKKISGRKKRGEQNWKNLTAFFDDHFKPEFNWRENCKWEDRLINSNRSYFDLAFGYIVKIKIPFSDLQKIDSNNDNIEPLIQFVNQLPNDFKNIVE